MKYLLVALSSVFLSLASVAETVYCGESQEVPCSILPDGGRVASPISIHYSPLLASKTVVSVDGKIISSSGTAGSFTWQPQSLGTHKLTHTAGDLVDTLTLKITSLDYYVRTSANPPMSKVSTISITPTTRSIAQGGAGGAIVTSGSGSWTAAGSDSWISLTTTSGSAGDPVSYMVGANTNVEDRVGYVYVAGYTHTITQKGLGATLDKTNSEVERDGGSIEVTVKAQNRICWQARPNVDWINVFPTSGSGEGNVKITVAPYYEVATRSGTLTIAGNSYTVFQYGSRMELEPTTGSCDYLTHVMSVKVDALAITTWSVTPNASWLSVVDGGNGQGSDTVTIAVAENPSYKERTGTVTIGTETFTVTQEGRTDLTFTISPTTTTANVKGANGLIAVTATPDLPWTAKSGANWLTILAAYSKGAGNGNVVYTASPNPTLSQRVGTITVTPEAASGMPTRTQTVTQPAAQSSISSTGYEFEAAGGSTSVDVTVDDIVEWKVDNKNSWITIPSGTSVVGPATVTIQAAANTSVYARSGTITIAGKTFAVTQKARGVEVEYDTKLFGTDGGDGSFSVHPDGGSSWTAVASDTSWIIITAGASGTGDGEVVFIIAPYVGTGAARTGTITVGDKTVYITQRAYDLTIDPYAKWVTGNSGEGEIGVSASIGDVWNAIVTEPWITIVSGYDSGTGSGTVRFVYTDNDTGKTRTGKIVVAGEVYTLTQAARTMLNVTANAQGGGSVSGGGSYSLGTEIILTAVPNDGYEFLYWTGDVSSMQNPIKLTVDVAKEVTAVFGPLTPEFIAAKSDVSGVTLTWTNLAWATQYKIYRAPSEVKTDDALATITADGTHSYLDASGEVGKTYWYWVEAIGATDTTECKNPVTGQKTKPVVISKISYTNLKGAANSNPTNYEEGTTIAFSALSGVTGYTFSKWVPAGITATMTGDQMVQAVWTANSYSLQFHANGGSGTMENLGMTYDVTGSITSNSFVRAGYAFQGWAMTEGGAVVYQDGQTISNLTAKAGGIVELYAVWKLTGVPAPVITPADGAIFTEDSCMVTLSCGVEDAAIYFTTNGTTPRTTSTFLYKEPFVIRGTVNIKAVAVYEGTKSAYVTATITKKTLTLASATGADEKIISLTTGGDEDWEPMVDATSSMNGTSACSGAIGPSSTSWLEATVSGAGTFTFWWKVDCEWDDSGAASWDHIAYEVDGAEEDRIDGSTDWEQVTVSFATSGMHTIRWMYAKDDYDEEDATCEDCAWVTGLVWTPEASGQVTIPADVTGGKPVDISESWVDEELVAKFGAGKAAAFRAKFGDDLSAAVLKKTGKKDANGNELTVWQDYVAGTDPTDEKSLFTASVSFVNGKPVITWSPALNGEGVREGVRLYKVFGAKSLTSAFEEVEEGNEAAYKFFKVTVEMP